jgi:hypothetical protein
MATSTILSFPPNGQTLKPIQTRFNGNLFRSRLEARWAVLFKELGIIYRYETEGYDLGAAGRYLPDFWLPDSETFVEIKPQKPTTKELNKAGELHRQSGNDVVILYGDTLDRREVHIIVFPEERMTGEQGVSRFIKYLWYCQLRKSARLLLTHLDCLTTYPDGNEVDNLSSQFLVGFSKPPKEAILKAKEARFEHGRNGA